MDNRTEVREFLTTRRAKLTRRAVEGAQVGRQLPRPLCRATPVGWVNGMRTA